MAIFGVEKQRYSEVAGFALTTPSALAVEENWDIYERGNIQTINVNMPKNKLKV